MRTEARDNMPNIREVAARAGVSIATVSRILNRDEGYKTKEETRRRVWQAANELGYLLPDRLAERARGGEGARVGCILNSNPEKYVDPFYQAVLMGIRTRLDERGQALEVFDGKNPEDAALQRSVLEAKLDALILNSTVSEDFYDALTKSVPVIASVSDWTVWRSHDLVTYDHREAVRLALNRLLATGRRKIAFVGGQALPDARSILCEPRCMAFCNLVELEGQALRREWVLDCEWSRRRCREVLLKVMSGAERPDAILAASDNMAAVALNTLYEMRLRVPDDVAVVGISDLVFAPYTTPPLTTVRVPAQEMGAYAADLVLQRLGGDDSLKKHVLFPVELVVRKSG